MYVCILDQAGTVLVHKNLPTTPEAFLRVIAPYRAARVVAGECMFTWSWLADLLARAGITFVLGHALSMKASHGGKAKNDKLDAHKIAVLLRGGMLPQAYVYPAERRATRALLRRRCPLMRQRAELLAHRQNTNSQYHLPEIGKKVAYKANRAGVEARLQSVPGIGQILALLRLYEIQDISGCPRVPDFVSSCRLLKCAKESAGKRLGPAGKKIGNVHLRWAVAEAAVLFLRHNQPGKAYFTKLEHQQGKAKALTVLAQKLARAVYYLLAREQAFALTRFVPASPLRGGTEPAV